MTDENSPFCDDDSMQAIIAASEEDSRRGVDAIDEALSRWPEDARLHFLRGSLLIGLRRFVEAHAALAGAVRLAPDFHIARFQLGLFELTSGEADAARASWAPLRAALPPGHYLARFVAGLEALIADRFGDCIAALRQGIAANAENPPLNADMRLIVAKCEEAAGQHGADGQETSDEVSATSFLLGARRN